MAATDPRLNMALTGEQSAMPSVARPAKGLSTAAIVFGAILLGVFLFASLDARRRAGEAPAVKIANRDQGFVSAAPPRLEIPPEIIPFQKTSDLPPIRLSAETPPQTRPTQPAPVPNNARQISEQLQTQREITAPISQRNSGGAALVFENNAAAEQNGGNNTGGNLSGDLAPGTERVRAAMLANTSNTVTQGTLIPAVLETALNSTSPGFARALISRDVYGFDGTTVLIPRGSRLIGEYLADASPGQKRALINWTRLIRSDGATIAIGSPAADPLGRGGIKANVNSHFFTRFSSAILQSALSIGANVAASKVGGTVIVALPGTQVGNVAPAPTNQVTPTLSVRAGTSISVFVARDLDFSDVEKSR